MQTINRRGFINNASMAIAGIAFANSSALFKKNNSRLSFSTLGCPVGDLPKKLLKSHGDVLRTDDALYYEKPPVIGMLV